MRDMQIGPEVGSCGAAAYLREIVVCEDLLNDSRWVGFIDLVRSEKIAACWSAPIISPSGELLGTFATYYRHCKSPELSEITLIRKAAGLAALAIEHQAERNRRVSSEQRFRSLFSQRKSSPVMVATNWSESITVRCCYPSFTTSPVTR